MPKRTEIIKRIATAAKAAGMKFEIKREGASHTIYSSMASPSRSVATTSLANGTQT
jgi:hypothetical protein